MRAAEKYAELAAVGEVRPVCKCHGITMGWACDKRQTSGGRWVCLEEQRKYYAANPEKARERSRQASQKYREANPDKVRESQLKYEANNREKVRESKRKWRAGNPEKHRESNCNSWRKTHGWYEQGGMATDKELERFLDGYRV